MPNLSRVWRSLVSRRKTAAKSAACLPQTIPLQALARPPPHPAERIPQPWHAFRAHSAGHRWATLETHQVCPTTKCTSSPAPRPAENQRLTIVTWNVDAASLRPRARITALLSHILTLAPAIDVIFLQEVSRLVLNVIMEDPRVCAGWFSTDTDGTYWGRQPFATMTLLSRARFQRHADHVLDGSCMVLGRVWRIKYHSRYDRDALCCDVRVVPPASNDSGSRTGSRCIRLVNVHLDSLAIRPSHRPGQLATVASALRDAGCGLVAGDFNPILPEDQTLVTDNGLVDAWTAAHGLTEGNTWGADRKKRYAPRRMDKVAMMGIAVEDIDILRPGVISSHPMTQTPHSVVPWSDHSGLRCTFSW